MPASSLDDIRSAAGEFGPAQDQFAYLPLEINEWRDRTLVDAARPGVYVWFDTTRKRVVRVGMSTVNARARALKHINDNTGGTMTALAEESRLQLILFTVSESERTMLTEFEKHLEKELEPLIPSLN